MDTDRLKALSNFPKSIFLGMEELRGRWAEGGIGSVTSASSSSTVWEIGWYSERLSIVKEVKWLGSWGWAEDATRRLRLCPHTHYGLMAAPKSGSNLISFVDHESQFWMIPSA